jgi:hypothetical protein
MDDTHDRARIALRAFLARVFKNCAKLRAAQAKELRQCAR